MQVAGFIGQCVFISVESGEFTLFAVVMPRFGATLVFAPDFHGCVATQ